MALCSNVEDIHGLLLMGCPKEVVRLLIDLQANTIISLW